jgi:hypothetical protein
MTKRKTEMKTTLKVWTTSPYNDMRAIQEMIRLGDVQKALSSVQYTNTDMSYSDGWVEVGVADVEVSFSSDEDITAKELEDLKAKLNKVRAENHMRENLILDRISKLQAISYSE